MLKGYVWWDTQDPQWPGWTLEVILACDCKQREMLSASNQEDETEAQREAACYLHCQPEEIGVAHDDAEAAEMRQHPERW